MIDRRNLLRAAGGATLATTAGTSLLGTALAAPATSTHADPRAKAFELTFIRSIDPDPHAAARFIRTNWYAMDAIALERGLMTSYELLTGADDIADWNLLMIVGYPDARGYEAIAAEFERIRAAHTVVPIDGRGFRDLARIVGSRRVLRG